MIFLSPVVRSSVVIEAKYVDYWFVRDYLHNLIQFEPSELFFIQFGDDLPDALRCFGDFFYVGDGAVAEEGFGLYCGRIRRQAIGTFSRLCGLCLSPMQTRLSKRSYSEPTLDLH